MSTTTATTGYYDATALLARPDALRARAAEDGFLCFRQLLPRAAVLALRRDILSILDAAGLVDREHGLEAAVAHAANVTAMSPEQQGYCGVGVPREVYRAVQALESFHRLPHHPALLGMYRTLLGGEIMPHPRHICRMMIPGPHSHPTPPHQDFVHIQGTKNVWTCWFPLGDCPVTLGGLSIYAGSHRDGVLPVHQASGAGGLEVWLCQPGHQWVTDDMRAGDVLTFPSLTVHKSLPNQARRHIRLSFDARYQRVDEPIHERSLLPHCQLATWDELYAGWRQEDLKYYWRRHALQMADFDESLCKHQPKVC
jgi:hypothetical protein